MTKFSDRELEALRKEIERAVQKFVGKRDSDIISTAIKCVDRGYERRKTRDRLGRVMDEAKASKFADKLMIIVDDFKASAKRHKKRKEESPVDHGSHHHRKGEALEGDSRAKRPRLDEEANGDDSDVQGSNALASGDNASNSAIPDVASLIQSAGQSSVPGVNYPFSSPGQLTAAKIKDMMASAQRMIAQRKMEIGFQEPQTENKIIRQDGMEKVLRASELQAHIQARLVTTGLINQSNAGIPGTQSVKPKESVKSVIVDAEGRTVDAKTGEVIEMVHYTPTLKANLRAKRAEAFKQELSQHAQKKPQQEIEDSKFFDGRLILKGAARQRRQFKFIEPGKFVKQAQRLRTKAQLQILQDSVAAAAKRTGIASAAKLAAIQPKRVVDEAEVPQIEWWDAYLLDSGLQPTYEELDRPGVTSVEQLLNPEWITRLVEHPIQMKPPAESDKPVAIPVMLTSKERKKLRRQNRQEMQKEVQEKIRLGLIPPPEPKVRLTNMMRVLRNETVQDPTKVEAYVRAQVERRRRAHEAANAARKLTKDQARNKKMKKIKEDTSRGVHVSVFRVKDLSNPAHRFKIEANANQLFMTGYVALHRDCNVVVVEGGPKQQKKFKHLMLGRVKWEDRMKNKSASLDEDAYAPTSTPSDFCTFVWEGQVKQRAFDKIQFKQCPTELFAREQFRKHDVEQYWDLAYSHAVLEAAGEELV